MKNKDNFDIAEHWNSYYSESVAPNFQSSFAEFTIEELNKRGLNNISFLEIGCGNGRDANFFGQSEILKVFAIDPSKSAIENCLSKNKNGVSFSIASGHEFSFSSNFDVIYSRFVLHAMPLQEEIDTIKNVYNHLNQQGLFFIECRSIHDPLSKKGAELTSSEKIEGHYRRFININELTERLASQGFNIIYSLESDGLAVYKDDNPVVIRIVAQK